MRQNRKKLKIAFVYFFDFSIFSVFMIESRLTLSGTLCGGSDQGDEAMSDELEDLQ